MIELYIDGHKVDLTTNINVPMNYELEKLENPTIIKNNFSKTIQLQATPANNKIFSFYYELDKIHTDNTFCANKRVPFQLFRDCNLIESGYLQLNNIKYTNNNYVYEITLYGGIGDFFYNLAYDKDGNDLTLADLNYGFGENDEDFEFQMNADNVMRAWDYTIYDTNSLLGGTITFVPSYNGLYEDFDNDKVLINTKDNNIFPTSFTVNNKTYSTFNGFGYAELNKELTEWQIRDLRCYKQRPALKLKKFIEAICKPENNGGYEVELDGANFFNKENPYYMDTWITLPLLNPDSEELPKSEINVSTMVDDTITIDLNGRDISIANITYDSDLVDEFGGNSTLNINVDFSLKAQAAAGYGNLLLSGYETVNNKKQPLWGSIGVWIEAKIGADLVAISDCLVFTKGLNKSGSYYIPKVSDVSNWNGTPNTNFTYIDGIFVEETSGNYIFHSGNSNTFKLKLQNIPNYENIEIKVCTKRWYKTSISAVYPTKFWTLSNNLVTVTNLSAVELVADTIVEQNTNRKTLQNTNITKKQLLKIKITPVSLLTSFTKLFGLYFVKDATKKKIKICTRNTFFENAKIIDIDNKIDYSGEYKIEPLMFNKKWYKLVCPPLDTTKMKTYKDDYYEIEYGQKRINTNYNFNTDVEDLYKDNKYQNIITLLDSGRYYRSFPAVAGGYAPPFIIDGCKYKLFQNNDIAKVGEKEYSKYDIIDKNKEPIQWTGLVGADVMPKICCFNLDNDKQSLNDLNISLVFFNGIKELEDTNYNPIYYTLSNDVPAMATFNEGTPIYLYSTSEYDINNKQICIRLNRLPQFTRYNIDFGNVVNSLDFGLPLETYINENYTEDSTLYNNFWQNFYQDQFNENTRKVTTYVKFDDIQLGNHSLSNFYYFNKCYWLLNRIVDYDIANPYKKVKCEFIKVNDLTNYTNGQKTFIAIFEVNPEFDNLETWEISNDGLVSYGGEWQITFLSPNGISTLQINMDGVKENEIQNHYKLENLGDGYYRLIIYNIIGDVGLYIAGN